MCRENGSGFGRQLPEPADGRVRPRGNTIGKQPLQAEHDTVRCVAVTERIAFRRHTRPRPVDQAEQSLLQLFQVIR